MANFIQNQTAVVISDLHVGDPKNTKLEDFRSDADFQRLLLEVIPKRAGWPATLIINGDFLDFPQVLPELGKHRLGDRLGAAEKESLSKLWCIMDGHPQVFGALAEYLHKGGQVLLLPGNHDIDFHWPKVFASLRSKLGGVMPPALIFVEEGVILEQGIRIEHGNQYAFDNRFARWPIPILKGPDALRLERPWGTLFMDLIYNNVEEMYPFVNKVYPHSALAWIALQSFLDKENVSPKVLARLALFFLTKGKRFLGEHLLGEEGPSPSETALEFLKHLNGGCSDARLAKISEEMDLLLSDDTEAEATKAEVQLQGLLGRGEEEGIREREDQLLRSGKVTLAIFGHTHVAVDGNKQPPWGTNDPRRGFNTGSWMPTIPIGRNESLRWEELKRRSPIHDIRYLVIELNDPPKAGLEPLLPPDRK